MLAINHNLSALNVSNTLSGHYSRLQTSTQRLSSGLRINSAADDAAGLAIRELMRADIAALRQGIRNVNDGISMIQTMDGALGVIDEKLIRMKELAEQAATGTYNSDQRLMIDSEFQAMGDEIDRIARATDFNGIHLLTAKMITWTTDEDRFVVTNPGSIENLNLSGGQAAAITKNIKADNLITQADPTKTISVELTAKNDVKTDKGTLGTPVIGPNPNDQNMTRYSYKLGDSEFTVAYVDVSGSIQNPKITYENGAWSMSNNGGASSNFTPPNAGDKGIRWSAPFGQQTATLDFSMDEKNQPVDFSTFAVIHPKIAGITVDTSNNTYEIKRNIVTLDNIDANAAYTATYNEATQTVSVNLKNGGGSLTLKLDNPLAAGDTINFDIELAGEVKTVPVEHTGVDPDQKVQIYFGASGEPAGNSASAQFLARGARATPGADNDTPANYYSINYSNCTREGLGLEDVNIQTQENAQNALVQVNDAIIQKDKIRAEYGAMQNRLENTMSNLSIQAENLQAAESRISDTEIAQEMMEFVRNQILTNSAVAMLAQANNLPQMVLTLIR